MLRERKDRDAEAENVLAVWTTWGNECYDSKTGKNKTKTTFISDYMYTVYILLLIGNL